MKWHILFPKTFTCLSFMKNRNDWCYDREIHFDLFISHPTPRNALFPFFFYNRCLMPHLSNFTDKDPGSNYTKMKLLFFIFFVSAWKYYNYSVFRDIYYRNVTHSTSIEKWKVGLGWLGQCGSITSTVLVTVILSSVLYGILYIYCKA